MKIIIKWHVVNFFFLKRSHIAFDSILSYDLGEFSPSSTGMRRERDEVRENNRFKSLAPDLRGK